MVNVGIIGIGNMGTSHLKNICAGKVKNMRVAAACDILEERRNFVKENYPEIHIYEDFEDMYKSGDIDTVLIAVPHYDHPRMAIKGFEYGLNVLTEKPAGVYTKQVLEMNEAAKKSGKVFGIMYNQRTNPVYRKIKELIEKGELGAIKRVSWIITDWYRPQAYHDSCTWRSTWKTEGGGALINQNPHQLDLWQWMFGLPDKIMSHVSFGKYYNIEVEDDVTAFMQYNNGMTGVYITSTGEAPGENRLEISCDMGHLVVHKNKITFDRNVESERKFNAEFNGIFGSPECWHCEIPCDALGGEQHVGILKNFADAIENGTPLLAPGEEGVRGLLISNAIHYSAWTGGWSDLNNFPHDDFYRILQEKIKNSKVQKKEVHKTMDTTGTY